MKTKTSAFHSAAMTDRCKCGHPRSNHFEFTEGKKKHQEPDRVCFGSDARCDCSLYKPRRQNV